MVCWVTCCCIWSRHLPFFFTEVAFRHINVDECCLSQDSQLRSFTSTKLVVDLFMAVKWSRIVVFWQIHVCVFLVLFLTGMMWCCSRTSKPSRRGLRISSQGTTWSATRTMRTCTNTWLDWWWLASQNKASRLARYHGVELLQCRGASTTFAIICSTFWTFPCVQPTTQPQHGLAAFCTFIV